MDRSSNVRRHWRVALGISVFLLIGAAAPTKCSPPLSITTLTGASTKAAIRSASGPACPTFEGPFGPVAGERQTWTARIAAKDPKEWLHVDPCLEDYGSGSDSEVIGSGPFVIYTARGDVHGTVNGMLDRDFRAETAHRAYFWMKLKATRGTGSYRGATGNLWYSGCLNDDETVLAAVVGAKAPSGPPKVCFANPSLAPLAGAASQTSIRSGSGPACPMYQGPFGEAVGERQTWTARIAGKDPKEWLHIDPCLEDYGSHTGSQVIADARFTIYTAVGEVHGNGSGYLDTDVGSEIGDHAYFSMELVASKGTGAYAGARGTLWYSGCLDSDNVVLTAAVTATAPSGPPSVCVNGPVPNTGT